MTKTYKITGLDCPNCSARIENKAKQLDELKDFSINFMTSKMIVKADEAVFDSVFEKILKIVDKIEPDAKVEADD